MLMRIAAFLAGILQCNTTDDGFIDFSIAAILTSILLHKTIGGSINVSFTSLFWNCVGDAGRDLPCRNPLSRHHRLQLN